MTDDLLSILPAPMNNPDSTAELPLREGRTGEQRKGNPYQGPCLPLADVFPLPHPHIISHMNNAGILFIPAKIYTLKN